MKANFLSDFAVLFVIFIYLLTPFSSKTTITIKRFLCKFQVSYSKDPCSNYEIHNS